MPTDPRRRQKKQEQKKAKRKSKHQQLVKQKNLGLADRLSASTRFPVIDSFVTTSLWSHGLGTACLSRKLPGGLVASATFLIDRYCLGVKNADAKVIHESFHRERIDNMRSQHACKDISPPTLRKFVESAAAYAADSGFPPHPDYRKAKMIFGDIDPGESNEDLEFGKAGKPFFISGPYDTQQRCRQIHETLLRHRGPGRFDYLLNVDPDLPLLEDSEDYEDDDLEDGGEDDE